MGRSIVRVAAAALVMALGAGACGGGSGSTRRAGSATTTTTAAAGATTSTAAGPELPKFQSDFKRVCTAQVGFSGATSYEPGPGPHPIALMEEYTGGWITTSRDLPQGWAVKEDSNFDDNSDLKPTQLVGCAHLAKQTPTGKKCDFDDKGTKVTLELVDTTFELTVYTATDSKPVHKATLQGTATECPMFATFKKGDTTYLNEPSDDQYIAALKPVVAP
jgi:hypothetical protein